MKNPVGRPRVYGGHDRRKIATAVKKYGLTKGIAFLSLNGLVISMTTAIAVAKEKGISLKRGRPRKVA